jgi:hypothetical protein
MEKFQFISLEPNKSGPEAWNETCIWLETPWNHDMPFYDARDHAIREGWQQPK